MARLVSLIVLTVLIVFLGIMFFQVVAPFLLPLFLAGVLAVLCQPLHKYFLKRTGNRPHVAAALTTTAVIAVVLVPLLVGTFLASVQLYSLATERLPGLDLQSLIGVLQGELESSRIIERLHPYLPSELRDPERFEAAVEANLRQMLQELSHRSLGLAGATLGFLGSLVSALVSLVMFVIALYYFLADGQALLAGAESLIPVQIDYQRQLLRQFEKVVRAVCLATFVAAIGQGLATAGVLYLLGFQHFFLLFAVATFMSLIPLAGAWLVWGPCAIWLGYQGHYGSAIFLALFGSIVVGTLDNVIRTYFLNTEAKLHPLLAFVSVLGGLQVMGLWGMFVGPIVACCLYALVLIFNSELKKFSHEKLADVLEGDQETKSHDKAPARVSAETDNDRPPASNAEPDTPAEHDEAVPVTAAGPEPAGSAASAKSTESSTPNDESREPRAEQTGR